MRNVVVSLVCVLVNGGALPGQTSPFPAWGLTEYELTPASYQGLEAPEWGAVDAAFKPVGWHRREGLLFDGYEYGMLSASGTIAVWSWSSTPFGRTPAFGIDSGLDRLTSLSLSDPGALFSGADAALVWAGFTAGGTVGVGALPLYIGQTPSNAQVYSTGIVGASGAVWVAAGIVNDGIGVVDGASGTLCWLDYGVTLHPGIAIPVPQELREPIRRVGLAASGEIELHGGGVAGGSRTRLFVGSQGVYSTSEDVVPEITARALPSGAGRIEVLSANPGVMTLESRAAGSSASWQSVSTPQTIPGGSVALLALTTPLALGTEVRLVLQGNLGTEVSPVWEVSERSPMIFEVSGPGGGAILGGGAAHIHGENLLDGVGGTVVEFGGESVAIVSASATECVVTAPTNWSAYPSWMVGVETPSGLDLLAVDL